MFGILHLMVSPPRATEKAFGSFKIALRFRRDTAVEGLSISLSLRDQQFQTTSPRCSTRVNSEVPSRLLFPRATSGKEAPHKTQN